MLLFTDTFVGVLSSIVVIKSCQQIEINEDSSSCSLLPMLVSPLTVVPQPLPLHSTACEGTACWPSRAHPMLLKFLWPLPTNSECF